MPPPSSPLEQARTFRAQQQAGLTQRQIAARAGVRRPYVNKRLALLALNPQAAETCQRAGLGFAHLYALCALRSPDAQRRLADQAVTHAWTVRQTERAVQQECNGTGASPRSWPGGHPDALALAQLLSDQLARSTGVPIEVRVTRGNHFQLRYTAANAAAAITAARQLGAQLPDHPTL